MIGSAFVYLTGEQRKQLMERVYLLLETNGVKLDPHPEFFRILAQAGLKIDESTGMVCFPREKLLDLVGQAPKSFTLGARHPDHELLLPCADSAFYARSCTGAHGWIDPENGAYRKVTLSDLQGWVELINQLGQISFLPFLFPNDAPVKTADLHALATVLKTTAKHVWVQPYSAASVEHLIALGAAAAGGRKKLEANPVISIIACSLTPRAFKHMDIEIMLHSARAGLPVHACSLPGAGGTAPATMAGTVLLAVAEILAMVAMIQAVRPGSPVVACPIIFSTDMRTGRSLQSSVEAMRGASMAVQVIRGEFNLPTHNYGSGSDSPVVDEQAAAERAMLTTLMAVSGSDILGGAGQLEVATAVSPLQLIVDNEILAMAHGLIAPFRLNEEEFGWEALINTPPGQHFMTSEHTFRHCREGFMPVNFSRLTRDGLEKAGSQGLMERVRLAYVDLKKKENLQCAPTELATEIDSLLRAADRSLL